jgi:hypothetical protein
MAATATKTILMKFLGDTKGLKKALGDSESRTDKWARRLKKLALLAGGAFAVTGLVQFGKDMTALGRRIEDLDAKAKTVFEGSLPAVQKWASENSKSLGVTRREATGLAANFADLLKPMGFTADQAADMSTDVVGLSGALAKWSGGSRTAADVSKILGKAMLGEREGLKELGISISEADVKRRLAEKGLENLTGAQLEQARAVATQELILEKSTDAQDAWAAGGRKAAEQQNAWRVSVQELREKIAKSLAPTIRKVTQFIGKLADWITDKGIPAAQRFAAWFGKNILPALKAVAGFIKDRVIPALVAFGTWIVKNRKPILIIGGLITAFFIPHLIRLGVVSTVQGIKVAVAWAMQSAAAIGAGVVHAAQTAFMVAKWVFLGVQSLLHAAKVAAAWLIAMGPIGLVIAAVVGMVTLIILNWEKIKEVVSKGWDKIKQWTKAAWQAIRGFVVNPITSAVQWVRDKFGALVNFVKGLPGKIGSAARGMWDGIKDAFRSAVNWLIDKWNSIRFTIGGNQLDLGPLGKHRIPAVTLSVPRIPRLHTGGIVPGPAGAEVPILAQAGETVLPTQNGPMMLEGTLVLDSGEFLGKVRGVISADRQDLKRRTRQKVGAFA